MTFTALVSTCLLVCHIKGTAQTEGVWEQGAEEIIASERDEVREEWEKVHSRKFHNMCQFPNIIRQIKSRGMSWAWHVARMGEAGSVQGSDEKARRKETTRKRKV
jgi:hypothetical protein